MSYFYPKFHMDAFEADPPRLDPISPEYDEHGVCFCPKPNYNKIDRWHYDRAVTATQKMNEAWDALTHTTNCELRLERWIEYAELRGIMISSYYAIKSDRLQADLSMLLSNLTGGRLYERDQIWREFIDNCILTHELKLIDLF